VTLNLNAGNNEESITLSIIYNISRADDVDRAIPTRSLPSSLPAEKFSRFLGDFLQFIDQSTIE
jgi:hypothetical protein